MPNELLYTSLTYLNGGQLCRASRVSNRWHSIATDPHVMKNHPQVGGVLKEKIIHDVLAQDTTDLDYLVGLSTPFIKKSKMNCMTWCLFITAARHFARKTLSQTIGREIMGTVWTTARGAARDAVWDVTGDNVMVYYYDIYRWFVFGSGFSAITLPAHTAATTANRNYRKTECLILLSIDHKLCRIVRDILITNVKAHQIQDLKADCKIDETKLTELCGNPWIKQYIELYHKME